MSTARPVCNALVTASPRGGVRAGLRGFVGATVAAWALVLACPGWLPAEGPGVLDLSRSLLAQAALQQDPVLAPLDLGVTVRKGVATLFGPVPSRELGERAAALLCRLPELSGVRNQLFLDPFADLLAQGNVTGRPRPPHWTASRPEGGRRPPPSPPGDNTQAPASPTLAPPAPAWIPVPAPARVPPSAVRKGPESPSVLPGIRVPAPATTTTPAIEAAVEKLRGGQERFRLLRALVQGDRVFLSGAVARWQDVYDLSQAITDIPGVAGVTIRAIRVDSPPR